MRELRTAAIAAVALTLVLGLAYPLVMTGVSRVVFPGNSGGSASLIGRDFSKNSGDFQTRPSATDHSPTQTGFNNQGPNQKDLADQLKGYVDDYLKRERPFTPSLTVAQVPVDAVTTSASGVDPDISEANARIQANRVARERGLPLSRVLQIVDDHASRPMFGLGGPKSINVDDLNSALDRLS
jgi:potassium-transporting ATPase KdpC subunit